MRFPSVPEIRGVEVMTRLHRGGMGDVFLGRLDRPPGFGRWVALKVIRPDLRRDAGVRSMFLDEARVLASLEHPAIAQVVDFGEVEGTPYLLIEYVAGLSFSRIRGAGPLPPPVAARMVAEVARGLHAAHEATDPDGRPLGIVHRDISPQNAMLTFSGRVKLLDFGIALAAERQAASTATGVLKGKLAYVAPEQIVGSPADRSSDTYSLSIVLHELLTGETLFASTENLLDAAKERRRPRRVSAREAVPRRLERIVMRGLAERREGRWPDALQLAEALEEFALRAGGESLEGYAARALGKARLRHAEWLRTQTSDGDAPTIPAGEEALDVASEFIEIVERAPPPPPRLPAAEGVRARRAIGVALGLGVLLLAGSLAYRVLRSPIDTLVALAPTGAGAPSDPSSSSASTGSRAPPDSATPSAPESPASSPSSEASSSVLDAAPSPTSGAAPSPTSGASSPRVASKPPTRRPRSPPAAPSSPSAVRDTPPIPESAGNARARGRWGRISLAAPEGGFVVIDGEAFGRTPFESRRIRAGPHVVELRWSGETEPRWRLELLVHEKDDIRLGSDGRVRSK